MEHHEQHQGESTPIKLPRLSTKLAVQEEVPEVAVHEITVPEIEHTWLSTQIKVLGNRCGG